MRPPQDSSPSEGFSPRPGLAEFGSVAGEPVLRASLHASGGAQSQPSERFALPGVRLVAMCGGVTAQAAGETSNDCAGVDLAKPPVIPDEDHFVRSAAAACSSSSGSRPVPTVPASSVTRTRVRCPELQGCRLREGLEERRHAR
jgi:hypothetical protein